ncbi:hypothetical protein K1X84_14670 [bacterium]|nr:hypothetical protein [bacterium]
MINQYKRQDVFRCTHDAHSKLGHHVSVYHTMFRKGCFPDGCTYFRWKCNELERKRKCYRGFSHVGKKCFGCKFFDEEKFTRSLVKTDPDHYSDFLEDLYEFEEWLRDFENKEHWCMGTVSSVKPHLRHSLYGGTPQNPKQEHTHLLGYLICFGDLYIDKTHFEDYSYAVIGREFQQRLKFLQGDRLEFRATVTMNEGRLLLQKLTQTRFTEKQEGEHWTDSRSLVARSTGNTLSHQAEKCYACDQGVLVDVVDRTSTEENVYHRIFCMQGMPSAAACTYNTSKDIYGQSCSNRYYQIKNKF